MTAIKYERFENDFLVSVPFLLKDLFKNHFKTSKWEPIFKKWRIGSRSEKKLIQFIELVNKDELMKTVETCEYEMMVEKEIKDLQEDMLTLNNNMKSQLKYNAGLPAKIAKLEKTKAMLLSLKNEMASVKKEEKALLDQQEQLMNDNKKLLEQIINFSAIQAAHKNMIAQHGKTGSAARSIFDQNQEIILAEVKKLRMINIRSEGLDELIYSNFNRPDRDDVRKVNLEMMLRLHQIDQ